MEFCGWHAILENEFIYSAAEYIRIVQLGRFSAISSALPRALGPIHFPVAPGRLGFNVDKRNAVHKEQDIGADVILWSFNPELIGRKLIISVFIGTDIVVIDEPNV